VSTKISSKSLFLPHLQRALSELRKHASDALREAWQQQRRYTIESGGINTIQEYVELVHQQHLCN
jgi:hypothetical protein